MSEMLHNADHCWASQGDAETDAFQVLSSLVMTGQKDTLPHCEKTLTV